MLMMFYYYINVLHFILIRCTRSRLEVNNRVMDLESLCSKRGAFFCLIYHILCSYYILKLILYLIVYFMYVKPCQIDIKVK